uniref:Uncharacterized protein n=1 Tax=Physcomitrium patens TaxID=3218 RepID=A0A2K1J1Q4_PHYPA|nr:hypothetical protein PHYPA_023359 [Physcomitrium patens]
MFRHLFWCKFDRRLFLSNLVQASCSKQLFYSKKAASWRYVWGNSVTVFVELNTLDVILCSIQISNPKFSCAWTQRVRVSHTRCEFVLLFTRGDEPYCLSIPAAYYLTLSYIK